MIKEKEFNLLHHTAALFRDKSKTTPELLQDMAFLLPSGWQYPEIATARIVYNGSEYRTLNYSPSRWTLSSEFTLHDRPALIEVGYLEEKPPRDEGPFLSKERSLINFIAMILQICLEFRETKEALLRSERNIKLLTSNIPAIVFKGYVDWSIMVYDNKVEEISGYSRQDFHSRRMTWSDIIVPEDLSGAKAIFVRALKSSHKAYVRDYRIKEKSGDVKWIQERSCIVCDETGNIDHIDGIFFDITDQKKAENELRKYQEHLEELVEKRTYDIIRANEQLRHEVMQREEAQLALQEQIRFLKSLMEAIPNPLFCKNDKLVYAECNKAFEAFLGLEKEDIIGKTVYDLSPENLAKVYEQKDLELMQHPGIQVYEARVLDGRGTLHEVIFNKATFFHADGSPGGLIGVIVDITERKRIERERKDLISELQSAMDRLRTIAITDELTDLYNRRFFFKRLKEEIERAIRHKHCLSCIMLDIDHFKAINDRYGHQTGDVVLRGVADVIKSTSRVCDTVARYGGEEIVILLPETDKEGVASTARRVRKSVQECTALNDRNEKIAVTISLGAASFSWDELSCLRDQDMVINLADKALYRAKERGRNRVEIWGDENPYIGVQ